MSQTWTLRFDPVVLGSAIEACVELGQHPLLAILNRQVDDTIEIREEEIPVFLDYFDRIEAHYATKYPHHDEEDPAYDEDHEDGYQDGLETYRHPVVYALADVLGDDFLERYAS